MFILFSILFAVPLLILRASRLQKALFKRSDRILLVIAHPDDESMFFSPTILSCTMNNVPVFALCLSNGGAYGIGKARASEMVAACKVLKIPECNVSIIDDPLLQDGMKTHWPAEAVADQLDRAVKKFKPTQIVTFDKRGVSGHPNHVCTYLGVLHFKKTQAKDNLEFHMLESTNIVRKFSGLLDLPLSSLLLSQGAHLVVSPSTSIGMQAMMQHKTQLAWYRIIFNLLSRYTAINTLQRLE